MFSAHSGRGLQILGFPSLEFLGQEFKEPKEIRDFVDQKAVKFDIYSTTHVNGKERHDVYKYLMRCTSDDDILWNFSTAFIVGSDGSVRARIDKPQESKWKRVDDEILNCLEEKEAAARDAKLGLNITKKE